VIFIAIVLRSKRPQQFSKIRLFSGGIVLFLEPITEL
jgi:hypothetical protein